MKEERGKKKVFWASKHRSVSAVALREAVGTAGAGGVWSHARVPRPLPEGGEGSKGCPRPPGSSRSISSCSGHSLLMIEMFDWAKFPTRMLHDSILPKALAAAHRRSAFTYSSLQSFAFPFVDLFQRTRKERVFIPVTGCRCSGIASQRRVILAPSTA